MPSRSGEVDSSPNDSLAFDDEMRQEVKDRLRKEFRRHRRPSPYLMNFCLRCGKEEERIVYEKKVKGRSQALGRAGRRDVDVTDARNAPVLRG
jgi:hypothetical protein